MCLEPPLRIDELPEEETWYCKKCTAERVSGTKYRLGSSLIQGVYPESSSPYSGCEGRWGARTRADSVQEAGQAG
jgi:hypothetical protein